MSSADVTHHILDFVVAKRLPHVMLENPVPYTSRKIADLASILLMLHPLPKVLADSYEFDLLPEKSR